MIAPCGAVCDECPFYKKGCDGCKSVEGKVFWAIEHIPGEICPMYDCPVNQKKLEHCGLCNELPCHWFKEMKDPSMTDEQHQLSIDKRVKVLKNM